MNRKRCAKNAAHREKDANGEEVEIAGAHMIAHAADGKKGEKRGPRHFAKLRDGGGRKRRPKERKRRPAEERQAAPKEGRAKRIAHSARCSPHGMQRRGDQEKGDANGK